MESAPTVVATRWSTAADSPALARVHRDAWRFAYAGVVPGPALERRIAARGPDWWRAMHERGGEALMLEFGGDVAGYATIGPSRTTAFGRRGEIYELYLDPVFIGAGFGRRLFASARRNLAARDMKPIIVWSLLGNVTGCRFYHMLGGKVVGRGRTCVSGESLEQIAFAWS